MSIFVTGNATMKSDQSRVQSLLRDTITLLCRNSLSFSKELKVQGLLGITMDDNSIFIVHIDESFESGTDGVSVKNDTETNGEEYVKVESVTKGRPEGRKRTARGLGRVRNTQRDIDQLDLEFHSEEKHGSDFATDVDGFVDNSAEQGAFESHRRIAAVRSDFSCEEDCKPFSTASADMESLSVQLSAMPFAHQLPRSSSRHVGDRLWESRSSHAPVLKSKVIKSEPYSAADCSQFTSGGPESAIVIPDENFAEMDKLFVGESNDLGYVVNENEGYLHSSVLNDSDTGEFSSRTARRVKMPPAYDQNPKSGNVSSFQCLPKSRRSAFNSSSIWKSNKKGQKSHRFQPNSLILTKSFHICGYPDCGKQFFHRRHLLRHQTQKHGRVPTRVLNGPRKDWTDLQTPDDCHVDDFIDYCTNSMTE